MSVDGRPFIGETRVPGLYVNTGHGALGWTMAMGSGALLADQLTGRDNRSRCNPVSAAAIEFVKFVAISPGNKLSIGPTQTFWYIVANNKR